MFRPEEVEVNGFSMQLSPHVQIPYEVSLQGRDRVDLAVYTDGLSMEGSTSLTYCVERDESFIYEH